MKRCALEWSVCITRGEVEKVGALRPSTGWDNREEKAWFIRIGFQSWNCWVTLHTKRVQLLNWLFLKAFNSLRFPYNDYAILNFSVAGVHVSGTVIVIVVDECLKAIKIENECNIIGNRCWKALFYGEPIWSNWFEGHQDIKGQSGKGACFYSLFSKCQRKIIRVDDGVGCVDLQIFFFRYPCKKKWEKILEKSNVGKSETIPKLYVSEGNQAGSRVASCKNPAMGKVYQGVLQKTVFVIPFLSPRMPTGKSIRRISPKICAE